MISTASVPATGGASKSDLRHIALARRKGLSQAEPGAAQLVKDHVLLALTGKSQNIAGYIAISHELDLAPTLESLHEGGFSICLPVNEEEPSSMRFRVWAPGLSLIQGPKGTTMPSPMEKELNPDVLLVPLVAFDRHGHRLGYGKGFYDRTLSDLRERNNIAAYGIAYDGQEIEAVPADEHDEPLDGIITPTRIIIPSKDI